MKTFFKDYGAYSLKMFVTQIAISLLGMTVSLVFMRVESDIWQLISSIFATLFYLFLIYIAAWEVGYKDHVEVSRGHKNKNLMIGLYMSLVANAVNFIFAALVCLKVGLGSASIFLQGMYAGIILTVAGEGSIPIWMYFATTCPAIIVTTVAYIFGLKDIKFTPLFNERSTERIEKKK